MTFASIRIPMDMELKPATILQSAIGWTKAATICIRNEYNCILRKGTAHKTTITIIAVAPIAFFTRLAEPKNMPVIASVLFPTTGTLPITFLIVWFLVLSIDGKIRACIIFSPVTIPTKVFIRKFTIFPTTTAVLDKKSSFDMLFTMLTATYILISGIIICRKTNWATDIITKQSW